MILTENQDLEPINQIQKHEEKFAGFGIATGIAAIAVTIVTASSVNTHSTQSDLMTKNIEALSQGGEDGPYTAFAQVVHAKQTCTIYHAGQIKFGLYCTCIANAGYLTNCSTGCIEKTETTE